MGAGLGEGTLVAVNLVEMSRYAPGLALVVAALVARKALGKPLAISAGVLLLMMVIPFTTWGPPSWFRSGWESPGR